MAHVIDRCDIIDMLEESATTGRLVVVQTSGGRRFTDRVRDVTTEAGEDWVDFRDNQRLSVSDILDCTPAQPNEPTYAGKL
ncbi:MAG TPA: hypothetical protein VGG33_19375 [Polyangia bacterium]